MVMKYHPLHDDSLVKDMSQLVRHSDLNIQIVTMFCNSASPELYDVPQINVEFPMPWQYHEVGDRGTKLQLETTRKEHHSTDVHKIDT